MTERACRTCRHFEPSSTLQRGWCRNPLLYGPQHSHLVDERSLDCDRGAGDFWEPARAGAPFAPPGSSVAVASDGSTAARAASMANSEDGPVGRPERNPRESRSPRGGERSRGGRVDAGQSAYQGQGEERYWTDYLRVALPVLGLLLLVGLLWYWASAIIGDGRAEPPVEPSVIAMVTPVMPATPPPVLQPTPPAIPLTPGLPATGTQSAIAPTQPMIVPPTAPVVTPIAAATLPPTPAVVDAANPCAGLPSYELGTTIVTTEEVNLRDAPSTDGNALRVLSAGTDLVTTGEAVEAGQCDWWPVSVMESGEQGYVIEEFVRLGQQ